MESIEKPKIILDAKLYAKISYEKGITNYVVIHYSDAKSHVITTESKKEAILLRDKLRDHRGVEITDIYQFLKGIAGDIS